MWTDLLHSFIQTVNNFCPADYTGHILEACQHTYANPIFNHCTATMIAMGIAFACDTVFGQGNWGASPGSHSSSHGGHASHSSRPVPSDTAQPESSSPSLHDSGYDTVLADHLPPEFGGHYTLSDVVGN